MSLAERFSKPYRVSHGKKFRLKDVDPVGHRCRGFEAPGRGMAPERRRPAPASCRRSSTRRIAGPCCSSSRRWTPPARTARSSTSCRASTRRAARCSRSKRRRPRSSITTSSGARHAACPSAAASASSTARTTKRCWWCACTPRSSSGSGCRRRSSRRTSGRSASRTSAPSSGTSRATASRSASSSSMSRRRSRRSGFLERLDEPAKNWKFSVADAQEREHWDDYMQAYEDTIRDTATPHAPWFVVPADHKWFTRLVVAAAIVDALEEHGSEVSHAEQSAAQGAPGGAQDPRFDLKRAQGVDRILPHRTTGRKRDCQHRPSALLFHGECPVRRSVRLSTVSGCRWA